MYFGTQIYMQKSFDILLHEEPEFMGPTRQLWDCAMTMNDDDERQSHQLVDAGITKLWTLNIHQLPSRCTLAKVKNDKSTVFYRIYCKNFLISWEQSVFYEHFVCLFWMVVNLLYIFYNCIACV